MAKPPENHRKQWTPQEERKLDELIAQNTPTRVIGIKLGRTEAAIYGKASDLSKSVKPVNQAPYNRRKK